jgi:hypothetical protein
MRTPCPRNCGGFLNTDALYDEPSCPTCGFVDYLTERNIPLNIPKKGAHLQKRYTHKVRWHSPVRVGEMTIDYRIVPGKNPRKPMAEVIGIRVVWHKLPDFTRFRWANRRAFKELRDAFSKDRRLWITEESDELLEDVPPPTPVEAAEVFRIGELNGRAEAQVQGH